MPHFVFNPDDVVIDEIVIWEDESWVAPPRDLYDDRERKFMTFYDDRDVTPAKAAWEDRQATWDWAEKVGVGLTEFIDRLGMTIEPKEAVQT